jgi:putative addiction module component (TIGR02574 family)
MLVEDSSYEISRSSRIGAGVAPASREQLAKELAESVMNEEDLDIFHSRGKLKNPPGSERTEEEWEAEIKRRMEAHDRGEAKTVPGEVVMKWLRKRMK